MSLTLQQAAERLDSLAGMLRALDTLCDMLPGPAASPMVNQVEQIAAAIPIKRLAGPKAAKAKSARAKRAKGPKAQKSNVADGSVTPPKRRGRPPGRKNIPAAVVERTSHEDESVDDDDEPTVELAELPAARPAASKPTGRKKSSNGRMAVLQSILDRGEATCAEIVSDTSQTAQQVYLHISASRKWGYLEPNSQGAPYKLSKFGQQVARGG
jgi:hypothetical protein